MADLLSAIGGPALAFGSSMLGGLFQQANANQQVQQQEQFQTQMSDTQYQRGVADLKAAGINPLLYFGADSAMPGASYAPENLVGNAVGSAVQAGSALSQIGLQGAQAGQAVAQTGLTSAQTDLTDHQRDVMIAEVMNLDEQRRGVSLSNDQKQIITQFYQDHPALLKTQAVMDSLLSPLAGAGKDVATGISMLPVGAP